MARQWTERVIDKAALTMYIEKTVKHATQCVLDTYINSHIYLRPASDTRSGMMGNGPCCMVTTGII